jgi:hypothetical protein
VVGSGLIDLTLTFEMLFYAVGEEGRGCTSRQVKSSSLYDAGAFEFELELEFKLELGLCGLGGRLGKVKAFRYVLEQGFTVPVVFFPCASQDITHVADVLNLFTHGSIYLSRDTITSSSVC